MASWAGTCTLTLAYAQDWEVCAPFYAVFANTVKVQDGMRKSQEAHA